jgi:N-acetylmuramoyl-L-alanine amidase
MIYLLAGHTPKGINQDPGAVANGYREADLTMELRDLVADKLRAMGYQVHEDNDTQRLQQVLDAINATEKDVVFDIHFNAGGGTGGECIVPERSTDLERELANKVNVMLSTMLRIRNRGVKGEQLTARKRIAVLRENGINCLLETCFIDNKTDMTQYQLRKQEVATELALLIAEFEDKLI